MKKQKCQSTVILGFGHGHGHGHTQKHCKTASKWKKPKCQSLVSQGHGPGHGHGLGPGQEKHCKTTSNA